MNTNTLFAAVKTAAETAQKVVDTFAAPGAAAAAKADRLLKYSAEGAIAEATRAGETANVAKITGDETNAAKCLQAKRRANRCQNHQSRRNSISADFNNYFSLLISVTI